MKKRFQSDKDNNTPDSHSVPDTDGWATGRAPGPLKTWRTNIKKSPFGIAA